MADKNKPPLTLTIDQPAPQTLSVDEPSAEASLSFDGYTPTPRKATPQDAYMQKSAPHRFALNFNEGFGIPQSVSENPMEGVQGLKMAVMHPGLEAESLQEMYSNLDQSEQALIDRAYGLQHMQGIGNKAKGFALGVYSAVPILGPAVVNALDRISSGDWAGGLGGLTAIGTQLFGGKLAGRDIRPVEGTGGEFSTIGQYSSVPKGGLETRLRRSVQSMTASGPEATTEKLVEAKRIEYEKALDKYDQALKSTTDANKDAVVNAYEEAKIRHRDYQQAVAQQQAEYQAKVDAQAAKHQKATQKAQDFNAQQQATAQQQAQLAQQLDQASAQHGQDISNLESNVHAEANRRFDAVRAQVGNPTAPGDPLVNSVKSAETDILQNIPENVKEFRSILGLEKEDSGAYTQIRNNVMRSAVAGVDPELVPYESLDPAVRANVDKVTNQIAQQQGVPIGSTTTVQPVDWNYLQSIKSRIDARLRQRGQMNGDLKRALFSVRDAVLDEMGNMANANGQGPAWQDARNFYRQYKEDFQEPSGPSGSGSPVAQSLNAVDPQNIRRPVLQKQSTIGNRHLDILNRPDYAQLGGPQAAQSAQSILDFDSQINNLPRVKEAKAMPEAPEPIAEPKPVPQPEAVPVKMQPPPVKEEVAPLTARDITNKKMERLRETAISWSKFHTYDWGVLAGSAVAPFVAAWFGKDLGNAIASAAVFDPAFIAIRKLPGKILDKPAVRDWIAQPLPEEMRVINNLPNDLQMDLRHGIKNFINQQRQEGSSMSVSPNVQRWLAGEMPKKSPGEQKKDLEEIQRKHQTSNPSLPIGQ